MPDPFDPPGEAWTPVSPRLRGARRLVVAAAAAGVLVASVVAGQLSGLEVVAAAGVVLGGAGAVWGWVWAARSVRAWGYAERDDDLLVRHGLLFRELVVVPYGRMQFVDVRAGPLARAFGLASVELHTAAARTDAHIPGLGLAEATWLRDRLAERGEARSAGL
ncbi:MAG: PH domain-containing protein [Actinomycetes bacterium]